MKITIPRDHLAFLVKAVSTDTTRPNLARIWTSEIEGKTCLVATDGHRLHAAPLEPAKFDTAKCYAIDGILAKAVLKAAGKRAMAVDVDLSEIDGKEQPPVKQVIPAVADLPHKVEFANPGVLRAFGDGYDPAAKGYQHFVVPCVTWSKTTPARLGVVVDGKTMTAVSSDDKAETCAVDPVYLADACSGTDGKVTWLCSDSLSPTRFVRSDELIAVVMPVRV